MREVAIVLTVVALGCGRIGFDDGSSSLAGDAGGDATGAGDGGTTPDGSPMMLALGPVADTFVVQNSPSTNENSTILTVGTTAAGNPAVMLIRFDVAAIAPTATVTSATLSLRQVTSMGTGTIAVRVTRVTATWDPAVVTYATRPGSDPATAVSSAVQLAAPGETTWSIPGIVQGWVSGTSVNFGLLFDAPAAMQANLVQFGSAEQAVATNRPQLLLTVQ